MFVLNCQACWTPKYVKAKQAQRKQAEPVPESTVFFPEPSTTLSGPALLQSALSQEEQVELSFNRFRRRLHVASAKWLDVKNGVNRGNSVYVSKIAACIPSTKALYCVPV